MLHRRATTDDQDAITDVIARAFAADPLWGPALARPDAGTAHLRPYWGLFVAGALRFPVSGVAGACDAATLWIPPGRDELDDEQVADLEQLIEDELPGSVGELHELFERFEQARPDEPHYYLTLFATRPESRGRGVGMALLRADLAAFDAAGVPTYLESSNPANDARYAGLGFRPVGRFEHPTTGAVVTTMWRDVPAAGPA